MKQFVGERRAKAEVKRLRKFDPPWRKMRGAPIEILERAIAEQFMEFYATHAATAAIAICIAALRSRR